LSGLVADVIIQLERITTMAILGAVAIVAAFGMIATTTYPIEN
jgi:hypothetical protein